MKLVLYNDKIWKVVARFSEYIVHPEVHKLAFLRPRTSKFTGWIWFSLPNHGPKVYLHFIPIFRSSQFTGRIWSDDGPEPSYLISNSNIAELVSLVTSQQWVSPFLSESVPNIHTGLPAQPSNSNFSATIKMDDSVDDVFATALANVNLKAAKNKEKTLAMKKLQLLNNRFVLYWWVPW